MVFVYAALYIAGAVEAFFGSQIMAVLVQGLVFANLKADVTQLANNVKGIVTAIGGTVFVIGVSIAGMMRILSFGSERRIALSNMALTAAIVGLIIMTAALTLQKFIEGIF